MMGTFDSNIIVTEKIKLHKKTNKEGLGSLLLSKKNDACFSKGFTSVIFLRIVEARSAEQSGINSCIG